MTTSAANASTINALSTDQAPKAIGECGPRLLTRAELDHVAAAGSKPGQSGGGGLPPPIA